MLKTAPVIAASSLIEHLVSSQYSAALIDMQLLPSTLSLIFERRECERHQCDTLRLYAFQEVLKSWEGPSKTIQSLAADLGFFHEAHPALRMQGRLDAVACPPFKSISLMHAGGSLSVHGNVSMDVKVTPRGHL